MTSTFPASACLIHAEDLGLLGRDLIGPPRRLDFSRPFLPDALARTAALGFLSPDERLRLNQIRGNAHLTMVTLLDGLVGGPRCDLLGRLRCAFATGFGSACERIGPTRAMVARQRAAPRLARALLAEQVVWMARRHVQAAALNARTLDPGFARLLLQHWIRRAPPAAGPSSALELCAAEATPEEIDAGVEGYRALCAGLSTAMQAQAVLDVAALERVRGHPLTPPEREQTLLVQNHAYWWTYVGCGLTHPRFAASVRRLAPGGLGEFDGLRAALAG